MYMFIYVYQMYMYEIYDVVKIGKFFFSFIMFKVKYIFIVKSI